MEARVGVGVGRRELLSEMQLLVQGDNSDCLRGLGQLSGSLSLDDLLEDVHPQQNATVL